jgi:hypothetical protein
MNIGFAVAAGIGALALLLHVFVGGLRIVRPLLAADFAPFAKWLSYFCFHLVSLTIVAMAAGFGWAAVDFHARPVAAVLTALAFLAALLMVYVAIRGRMSIVKAPPFWLYFSIAVAGFWGLYGSFWDLAIHPL